MVNKLNVYSEEGHRNKFISNTIGTTINNLVYGSPFLRKKVQDKATKSRIKGGKLKGKRNPRWKGGRRIQGEGYIAIHKPEHPFSNPKGYVMEHRLVMEKKVGRYLKPTERVHHINWDKKDNKIDNLHLFPSIVKHRDHHRMLKGFVKQELEVN